MQDWRTTTSDWLSASAGLPSYVGLWIRLAKSKSIELLPTVKGEPPATSRFAAVRVWLTSQSKK
jgi:hypothetical protein